MARTSRRLRRGASAGRARRAQYGMADTARSKIGRTCKCEDGRVHGVIWQRYWGAFPWPSLTRRWASMIRGTGPRTRAQLPGTLCVDLTGIIVPEGLRREDTIQRTLGSWREPTTQIAVCMRDTLCRYADSGGSRLVASCRSNVGAYRPWYRRGVRFQAQK